MKTTTLCYIEKDEAYLMLHRVKKINDENRDKWIGIGGKVEAGETPHECARREIFEETGLSVNNISYRADITFISDIYGTELMHLFTCDSFSGEVKDECDEGELVWIEKTQIQNLNIWEGDKIFLDLLDKEKRFFHLTLVYQQDTLISHSIEYK